MVLGDVMNDEEPKYKDFDDDLIGTIWAIAIFFVVILLLMGYAIVRRML